MVLVDVVPKFQRPLAMVRSLFTFKVPAAIVADPVPLSIIKFE